MSDERGLVNSAGYRALDKMMVPRPWHDTPLHVCASSAARGPIVPFSTSRPQNAPNVRHVKCAACGDDWIEYDDAQLARIWWSSGAWTGHQDTELLQLERLNAALLCAWCGQPVSAVECVQRQSMINRQRMVWHWGCEDEDPACDHRRPWDDRIRQVSARGEGRIGHIEEGACDE